MATKKENDYGDVNKEFKDLLKKVGSQNFESEEEMRAFLQLGEPAERTQQEESEDLVYEAYESTKNEAKKLIEQALKLDPNNVEAYIFLARKQEDLAKSIDLYKTAIEIAEINLGSDMYKKYDAHFWGAYETRPFMKAKAGLADRLLMLEKKEEAIEIYEQMLHYNPFDNQGVRYLLSSLYLEKDNFKKFKKLHKKFPKEGTAAYYYNMALYHFKKIGLTPKADKFLLKAYKKNIHVIDFLLGDKTMPEVLPGNYMLGEDSEAIIYVANNWHIWQEAEDALEWAFTFRAERIQMN